MMRFSLSSGNVQHVVVGDFDTISLLMLQRLFKFGGHHDYEHEALQISLGGQVALRGWQCKEFFDDHIATPGVNLSKGDISIIGALANSLNTEFRLRVFEPHEEKVILTEALEDLERDGALLLDNLNDKTAAMRTASNAYYLNRDHAHLMREKIASVS